MPDERFRMTVGVTDTDRQLIDEVWAAVQRRNRWRLRRWRLVNVLRALTERDRWRFRLLR